MPDKKPDSPTDTPDTSANNAHSPSDSGDSTGNKDEAAAGNLYDRGTPEVLRRAIDKLQPVSDDSDRIPVKRSGAIMRPTTSALPADDTETAAADSASTDDPAGSSINAENDADAESDTDKTRELNISASASEAPADNSHTADDDEAAILSSWEDSAEDTDTPDDTADDPADNEIVPAAAANLENPQQKLATADRPPWTLQQFFNGEIDLDVELSKRFPNMPMMTSVKFRNLGNQNGRRVATSTTQDGSSSLVIDADMETKAIQLSFTYGSMMTLRYSLISLNDIDRKRWLELMNREQGGLAFLWGPSRWQDDYLICIGRRYFTNLYAFSPNQFESAVRLSPSVIEELLAWLDEIWHSEPDDDSDDDNTQLLTW